jgi:hypothetical protein
MENSDTFLIQSLRLSFSVKRRVWDNCFLFIKSEGALNKILVFLQNKHSLLFYIFFGFRMRNSKCKFEGDKTNCNNGQRKYEDSMHPVKR